MSEKLLKTATMRENGTAYPLLANQNGALITADSRAFVPRRNSPEEVLAIRESIWEKYVEDEISLTTEQDTVSTWSVGTTGDGSVELVSPGKIKVTSTAGMYITGKNLGSIDMSSYDSIRLTINTDITKISRIKLRFLAPDSSNSFDTRYSGASGGSLIDEMGSLFGKGTIAFKKNSSAFTEVGNPDWANVTKIYIYLEADSDPASITISDFKVIKQKPKHAKFILRMDDGLKSVYDVAEPALRDYNVPGALFVNPGYVLHGDHATHIVYGGTHLAMSFEEIEELHNKGWSVSGHTYYHKLYRDPTIDTSSDYPRFRYHQAYHDLASVQDWLIDNGFGDGAYGSVYGNHFYNAETMEAALDLVPLEFSHHSKITAYDPLPWGSSLRHLSATYAVVKDGDTYPNLDPIISNHGLCVIMFHRFDGDDLEHGSVSVETLTGLVEYLLENDADIITVSDLIYATSAALR